MAKKDNKETIEEFLKRGGTITRLPEQPHTEEEPRVSSTTGPSNTMMTLAEGAQFYAEARTKTKRKPKESKLINFSALPAALMKFVHQNEDKE